MRALASPADAGTPAIPETSISTIAQALRHGAEQLAVVADNPRLEAHLLLAHANGLTRTDLTREPTLPIDTAAYENYLARRITREPLALIIGRREFWSLEFQVSAATLIPRPDSETLIEATLAAFAGRSPPRRILDLGTGTGCLLLALLTEFPSAFGIGLDRAEEAAALAKANAARLGLADRSAFAVGDWTNPVGSSFDLIVSNPPYIKRSAIDSLMPEVANYEARTALDGGADGYDAYRTIVPRLRQHLEQNGAAVLELGEGQATYVAECAREAGLRTTLRRDLAAVPRAIVLTLCDREKIVWQS
jgi:release factor glutamine methyltransferase